MSSINYSISKNSVSKLSLAVITALTATSAFSAGLDRSGQDVSSFFQEGTYAEAVYTYIDADVTGVDSNNNKIENIVESYDFERFALKADINDTISFGILYDEPLGAAVKYQGENDFVASADMANNIQNITGMEMATAFAAQAQLAQGSSDLAAAISATTDATTKAGLEAQKSEVDANLQRLNLGLASAQAATLSAGEGTNVEIRTSSLTGLVGVKVGKKKNIQIYGGPILQRLHGDLHLRGTNYAGATGYDAHMSPTLDMGFAAGAAYSKPEIGLRASLTYRSEIEHESNFPETIPLADNVPPVRGFVDAYAGDKAGRIAVTTPESVNFDFQTGLNPTTLATANVRYVPWSSFAITPIEYNALTKLPTNGQGDGLPIASYSDDQLKVELGLAKRMNSKLALSGNVGWDSGAGNPVTSLGPIEGFYSAGLGAKYNVTDQFAVSVGGKYLWFGDAEAQVPTGNVVGKFEDNEGFIVGVKLSYQDK